MLWIYKESLVREHPKRFPRGEAVTNRLFGTDW